MSLKYNVLIVDDHAIFREGLKVFLETFPFVEKVYSVQSVAAMTDILKNIKIDVIFMDINMPLQDGIEGSMVATKLQPNAKIIGISSFSEIDYIDRMLASGASGYLLKDASREEIENAITKVISGEYYFSARVLALLSQRIDVNKPKDKNIDFQLSEREKEILILLCNGASRSEIAQKLFISERTVDKHRENILMKTNTENVVKLVIFALKNGLINFNDLNL